MLRINAWSSPRNISTALMYSFAQRSDTTVVDEPLYAHYLSSAGEQVTHPGAEEIMASQERDGALVIRDVLLGAYDTPVVLFKQMTHHLVEIDWSFLKQTANILLIRNPRAIINSYAKVIARPTMQDVGIEKQFELFEYLRKAGRLAAVIDAHELLRHPAGVLQQLCDRLGLPFEEKMLHWPAGPRPEDGVWAKHWYSNVHRSTSFHPYEERSYDLAEHLEELAEACCPYYEALFKHALRGQP